MINPLQMYNQFVLQHVWLMGVFPDLWRTIGDATCIFAHIVTSRVHITSTVGALDLKTQQCMICQCPEKLLSSCQRFAELYFRVDIYCEVMFGRAIFQSWYLLRGNVWPTHLQYIPIWICRYISHNQFLIFITRVDLQKLKTSLGLWFGLPSLECLIVFLGFQGLLVFTTLQVES